MGTVTLVQVGYTTTRPIIPDQHTAWVSVGVDSPVEAQLIAAQMVGCHCEMVTSTRVVAAARPPA